MRCCLPRHDSFLPPWQVLGGRIVLDMEEVEKAKPPVRQARKVEGAAQDATLPWAGALNSLTTPE